MNERKPKSASQSAQASPAGTRKGSATRAEKLAEALRKNLLRRKADTKNKR